MTESDFVSSHHGKENFVLRHFKLCSGSLWSLDTKPASLTEEPSVHTVTTPTAAHSSYQKGEGPKEATTTSTSAPHFTLLAPSIYPKTGVSSPPPWWSEVAIHPPQHVPMHLHLENGAVLKL